MGNEIKKLSEIDIHRLSAEILKDMHNIFDSFSKLKIAVFGDVMLDEYLIGDSTRISPEAPVPVVHIEKSYSTPGGAANTSVNIRKIGECKVKIFSVVGEDTISEKIENHLKQLGIETFFVRERQRKTPHKIRVIARGQQVIRIDNETVEMARKDSALKLIKEFSSEKFDVIVFSDYAKGNATEYLNEIISKTKSICDPKPKNIRNFQGAYMILPNEKEAQEIFQISAPEISSSKLNPIILIEKLKLKKLVITQGEKGMSFFSVNKSFHIPALAREVYDVTGAGDTVSAVFGLCEGVGLEDEKSSLLSSIAASVKVSHRGTYAPSKKEIINTIKQIAEQQQNQKSSNYSEK